MNIRVYLLTIISINLLFAGTSFAVGGGGDHAVTWKDWFWPIINFGILVFVLVYFFRKPAGEFFKKRTEMIEKSLKEATEARELAQKTLDEVKSRLDNSDNEVEEILEAAKKAGQKEKEAIIAEGEKMKDRMLEQAKSNIDFELQKAKDAIKSDAANLALELAEKQIKEQLGEKEQKELVEGYIKRLEDRN